MPKIIIITGASRGIGREIAIECASEGNFVVANYNKSVRSAQDLEENYQNISICRADVSKPKECMELVKFAIEKYGKIDVLINNAGISKYGLFTDLTVNEWNDIMQNNLYSAFYMSQEALKYMIPKHSGCIINISSIWGMVGASCEVAYSVSKAGLDGMTKALAKEVGPSGIRVNSIAPRKY